MAEIMRLTEPIYIAASSSASQELRVLKHVDSFAVLDLYGDIRQTGLGEQGVYHEATRYLSHLVFRLGTAHPSC